MNKHRLALIVLIAIIAIGLGFFDLPYATQQKILPFLSNPTTTQETGFLSKQKIHLGLDLQGGTQLDYKIDLSRVDEADRQTVIDGVFEVITKRVNGLGVAEPNIYRSTVANEEHIVVELAGIKDIEKAKEIVGKTIQLEFKTENPSPTMSESEIQTVKNTAQSALDRILAGEGFSAVAEEASLEDPTRVNYFSSKEDSYTFASDMNADFLPYLNTIEIGGVIPEVIQTYDGYVIDASGIPAKLDGFYLVKLLDRREGQRVETTVPETEYNIEKIYFATTPDAWSATTLTGEHFVRADVEFNQNYEPYVSIQFDDEGATLFEELTGANVNKRLAIFVGGQLISAPNVNEKISGGNAQISGQFSIEEATNLARDLNTGAIPAPIVLVGQSTIGASLGQEALDASLFAGLIGVLILMTFMLLYYRLPGLLANISLIIYSIILIFVIKVAMPLALALIISLGIFCVLVSIILKSDESIWEKILSFLLACFILFFFTYLLSNPITLTLAGVAGVVLSIGMAVDANILIFERIKEELHSGRPLSGAVEVGFDRAWSSIRDSNFSSLITCAILIYFGTSITKGFAVNLALGILISMFTAITITRTFLRTIVRTKLGTSDFLMCKPKKGHTTFRVVQKRKLWFAISGLLILASIFVVPMKGLNLGLDFTGGTLMEIQFSQPLVTEGTTTPEVALTEELKAVETTLLNETTVTSETSTQTDPTNSSLVAAPTEQIAVDLGDPIVVSSGENTWMIRMKHVTNETHESLLAGLEAKFGPLEEIRYNTIGATVGAQMAQKAVVAIILALIAIVLYIAFAFRHIPRHLSPWRFGVSAIVALAHDVFIPVGVFAVLGAILDVQIDALFITAVLTIIGFSVHDTIVVFDRIRENVKNQKTGEEFEDVANRAVNETLARSINTSGATLMTIAAMFFFGAEPIHYFVLALMIGIFIGTYSSIFIATPVLVIWNKLTRTK